MYYDVFGELCEQRGIRPADVSRATGISTATLSSWKTGKYTPKRDKLQKIADYFGVSVETFYRVPNSGLKKEYYETPEHEKMAHEMFEDRDMRMLFDIKKNIDPDRFAIQMRTFRDMYRLEHPEAFPEDYND